MEFHGAAFNADEDGGLASMPVGSPRLLMSHLPLRFFPRDALEQGCRVVYGVRNPKDVVVSLYHFYGQVTRSEALFCLDEREGKVIPVAPTLTHM